VGGAESGGIICWRSNEDLTSVLASGRRHFLIVRSRPAVIGNLADQQQACVTSIFSNRRFEQFSPF
jgi:hypothetical protein